MDKPPSTARKMPPSPADPLAPFKDELCPYFPSKDALLKEARAYRRGRSRTIKAVAALALAFSALWLADPAWQTEHLATRIGERSEWTLRDGTRIQLNTASALVVENHLRSRRLRLEQGEAMFTVAHGWRSFVVTAAGAQIRDIGTVFNVRRDGATVSVAVVQGAVEVSPRAGNRGTLLAGGQAMSVSAGQLGVPAGFGADIVAWADGKLVLDGTPLRQVVAEMQRYRRAPIRLRDDRAGNLRLSGEYRINDMESLVDALPDILPISMTRAADGAIDISSR
ncbi:FecR family protein [Cupriavidus sp. 8B]